MKKPTVLLVDETDFFIRIEKQFLRYAPVTIVEKNNYLHALEFCRDNSPALAFVDRGAPELRGIDWCRQVRSGLGRTFPIIAVRY